MSHAPEIYDPTLQKLVDMLVECVWIQNTQRPVEDEPFTFRDSYGTPIPMTGTPENPAREFAIMIRTNPDGVSAVISITPPPSTGAHSVQGTINLARLKEFLASVP